MSQNRGRVTHEWIRSPSGRDKSTARHHRGPQVRVVTEGNASIGPDVFYGASRPHWACLWIPVE